MLKKFKNLAFTFVLVCSMVPMVVAFGETATDIRVGGKTGAYTENYTPVGVKEYSNDTVLFICQDAVHYGGNANLDCKLIVQGSSTQYGTYYAKLANLTYDIYEGCDWRMVNSEAAGDWVRVRIRMNPTAYYSYYDVLYHYY